MDSDTEDEERREFYQAIGYSEDEDYMEFPKEVCVCVCVCVGGGGGGGGGGQSLQPEVWVTQMKLFCEVGRGMPTT